MSPEILEIIFFAAIAFFIFRRLNIVIGTEDSVLKNNHEKHNPSIKNLQNLEELLKEDLLQKNIMNAANYTIDLTDEELQQITILSKRNEVVSLVRQIKDKYSAFVMNKFLISASRSYELILEAFQEQDIKLIENLCDQELIEKLRAKIAKIQEKQYIKHIKIVDLKHEIQDILVQEEGITIKILFISRQFSYVTDKNDEIISGSKNHMIDIQEQLTFIFHENNKCQQWLIKDIQ